MIFFTCAHCHKEHPQTTPDDKVIKRFKKWYPHADLTSAKLVCGSCYEIALRILQVQTEQRNWIKYAMEC